MPTGRGELERAARPLLSPHVCEIRIGGRGRIPVPGRLVGRWLGLAAEIGSRFCQVPDRHRLDSRERRLRGGLGSADQPLDPGPPRPLSRREHAADRSDPPVERELADRRVHRQPVDRNLPRGAEHGERDRQIEA